MDRVLITGGNGFLGTHLAHFLKSKGKEVSLLGRTRSSSLPSYLWDIKKQTLDVSCFTGTGTIIHLAGAGIADKRWTESYKKEIVESRVNSTSLLFEKLKSNPHQVKTIISASAIGYYGNTGDVWVEEDFQAPEDFLGTTCREWEKSVRQFETIGLRVVILRIGLVLAKDGGILPAISLPVKLMSGAPLGNGKQYMSWIHVSDLCRLFNFAIDNLNIHGVYNAVAPTPVRNKEFIKKVAKTLRRPVWPISIPSFLLRMILGEKAEMVLNGQRVSNEKIRMTGFTFEHNDLDKSLDELL